MKETMKFCKDCIYMHDNGFVDLCIHPVSMHEVSLITGNMEYRTCYFMRFKGIKRGPTGELFEPSLWYRIKNEFTRRFKKSYTNHRRIED
jgi:hypothetical protein